MFNKIRDFMDTNVSMIILMDTEEELSILAKIFCSIGRERLSYEESDWSRRANSYWQLLVSSIKK